ncbi:hypothetical protein [Arcticibacterium luteifluviistationis]|uniref:DUF4136 domain-containing protein n=1 Tax=Arcticibacterium luteifluviistationis TaxID=1784714 RepID=A0A2Z4GDC5_9BACT|nr:hypothetical protein [Arcticibacterium luteifluviistationis]AWV99309.1 hypothetical protein DJ013_14495 [Arcticibacterium luteifluviistationis]
MKRILTALVVLTYIVTSCASNAPYVSADVQNAISYHQKIAVLPFDVSFNEEYKQNRRGRTGADYWREQERLAGLDMQKEFFISVAKQVEKGKFEKVVQDFLTTNRLLESAGVKIYDIPKLDKGELCRVLNVDAVVWGETSIVVNPPFGFSSLPGGATTFGNLYDGRTGELLWQKKLSQTPTSRMDTPQRLGAETARQLAKILPYER